MTKAVFEGIRVVEFSQGMPASLAGTVFADYGAEVIKVEAPTVDDTRDSPGFHMWHRGKKSVVLDLANPADRDKARRLCLTAEIVLHDQSALMAVAGLNYETLKLGRSDIIVCAISGFGVAAHHEGLGSADAVVAAKSGRLMHNTKLSGSHQDVTNHPIFPTTPFSSFGAAMLAVQGTVAALIRRRRTGFGDEVKTSVLDGISASTMRLSFERKGDQVVPLSSRDESARLNWRGIALCFLTVTTQDARYIQMCCRAPRLYRAWMKAIGLEALQSTERWRDLPLGVRSMEDADEWERLVRDRMAQKTQEEWMDVFRNVDVGADPFLTFDEFLTHPQMLLNDRIVTLPDEHHGPIRMVGPLVLCEKTPANIAVRAPRHGEHQGLLARLMLRDPPRPSVADCGDVAKSDPPLKGFTIVELASFLAAPLGATLLAELGARIIKIEPLGGDPFRSSGLEFVHIGNGKESLALDLKDARGQEIVRRIVGTADALVHNFRPGVAKRLGIDYEDLRSLNAGLVYLYGASYGSRGPESHRAAFHSTPHALCGGGVLQGGEGNPPVNDSYADPCSGLVAGVALVIGLWAREVTGVGQYLETSMLASTGWVHSERLVNYSTRRPLPLLDSAQAGLGPLHRLYPAASGWVLISADEDRHFNALARISLFSEALADARFATPQLRREHANLLTDRLATVFLSRQAQEWEELGSMHAVSIVSAGDYDFEQFLVREKLVTEAEHRAFGTYWKLPPRVRFGEASNRVGSACAVGEHSRALLREHGHSDEEVEALLADGVLVATKH